MTRMDSMSTTVHTLSDVSIDVVRHMVPIKQDLIASYIRLPSGCPAGVGPYAWYSMACRNENGMTCCTAPSSRDRLNKKTLIVNNVGADVIAYLAH